MLFFQYFTAHTEKMVVCKDFETNKCSICWSFVLGSAVGMDKDFMKRLLNEAGIKNAKCIVVYSGEKILFKNTKKILGLPMFIKPANMGSSVGISKVKTKKNGTVL